MSSAAPPSIVIPDRDDWYLFENDLPWPKWHAMSSWMRAMHPEVKEHFLLCLFARQWLERLRAALGGRYVVEESAHFFLLSEAPAAERGHALAFLEQSLVRITGVLGETYDGETRGKFILLRFTELDDYYAYIARFYPEGDHTGSAGVFLSDSYYHMAYASGATFTEEKATMAHELAHNLLAHLPPPAWLNEALAMGFQRDLGGGTDHWDAAATDREFRAYWNASTIQTFWTGESFGDTEAQNFSYSLAFLLLKLIHMHIGPSPEEFRRFVRRADWHDAGAEACREHLGLELGELVSGLLGPGLWQPADDFEQRMKVFREGRGTHPARDDADTQEEATS